MRRRRPKAGADASGGSRDAGNRGGAKRRARAREGERGERRINKLEIHKHSLPDENNQK